MYKIEIWALWISYMYFGFQSIHVFCKYKLNLCDSVSLTSQFMFMIWGQRPQTADFKLISFIFVHVYQGFDLNVSRLSAKCYFVFISDIFGATFVF